MVFLQKRVRVAIKKMKKIIKHIDEAKPDKPPRDAAYFLIKCLNNEMGLSDIKEIDLDGPGLRELK